MVNMNYPISNGKDQILTKFNPAFGDTRPARNILTRSRLQVGLVVIFASQNWHSYVFGLSRIFALFRCILK